MLHNVTEKESCEERVLKPVGIGVLNYVINRRQDEVNRLQSPHSTNRGVL